MNLEKARTNEADEPRRCDGACDAERSKPIGVSCLFGDLRCRLCSFERVHSLQETKEDDEAFGVPSRVILVVKEDKVCGLTDRGFDEKGDDEDDGSAECPVGGEGSDPADGLGANGVDDPAKDTETPTPCGESNNTINIVRTDGPCHSRYFDSSERVSSYLQCGSEVQGGG